MLSLEGVDKSWKDQLDKDQSVLLSSLEKMLSENEVLTAGNTTQAAKSETAVLLQYELNTHSKEGRLSEQASLEKLLERFVRVSEVPTRCSRMVHLPRVLGRRSPSFASDVYSFAMCIIQVVSREMPWGVPMAAFQLRYQWKKAIVRTSLTR